MVRAFSALRNRMLADPSFLFKVGTEVCSVDLAVCFSGFRAGVYIP
jgi:hypothetical protein